MNQRKIVTIGETLLDILFKNSQPVAAKPGGSMLNTSVTLGRLRLPVTFISEWGQDEVGNMIRQFLEENRVDLKHVYCFAGQPTTLALAFLDEKNNASYSFYKNYPPQHLQVEMPSFSAGDIFLFGSFFALSEGVRPRLIELMQNARDNKALIIYDPNFRKAHLQELEMLYPLILENFSYASVVKGSDEDFQLIFGVRDYHEAYKSLNRKDLILFYTQAEQGVWLKTPQLEKHYQVPSFQPVSTVGAGDTFSAGIIDGLYRLNAWNNSLPDLSEENWDYIMERAIAYASQVCQSYDNYISLELAKLYR